MKSAGVVVGRVESITFNDKNFQARLHDAAAKSILVSPRTVRSRSSPAGLLGEQYIGIEAGRRRKEPPRPAMPSPQTQSAVVLENLISQFLYSKAAEGSTPAGNANNKK